MVEHERKISKSIDLNIVGTTNIVKACEQKKTKLVFSQQVIFIRVKKVNIKKQIQFCLGITMAGQNLGPNVRFKCIITH